MSASAQRYRSACASADSFLSAAVDFPGRDGQCATMRLRVTLLHDGTSADVDAALTALWRSIPAAEVDVHLVALEPRRSLRWYKAMRSWRPVLPYLTRDRCDVVHAWLARPALLAGVLRQLPDRPSLISGIPGSARRMERDALASAAHLGAGFMADMITTWHGDTRRWLIRNGLPSDAVAVVANPATCDDPEAVARHYVRLYHEAVARRGVTWRRYVRLPSLR